MSLLVADDYLNSLKSNNKGCVGHMLGPINRNHSNPP